MKNKKPRSNESLRGCPQKLPCRPTKGAEISKKSELFYNPYSVKWLANGGRGVKKVQKIVQMVCEWPPI